SRPAALGDAQALAVAAGGDLAQRNPDLAGHGIGRDTAVEQPVAIHPQAREGGVDVLAHAGPAPDAVEPGERPGERKARHRARAGEPKRLVEGELEAPDAGRGALSVRRLQAPAGE